MNDQVLTYYNVTGRVFNCFKQKLVSIKIEVPPGNEGDIEVNYLGLGDIKGHFKWDTLAEKLEITIISMPFFLVGGGLIRSVLNEAVYQCKQIP